MKVPPSDSAAGEEAARRSSRRTTSSRPLGRDDEIERILQCVRREPGGPQALLLLGEEGIGRTTLLRHARELAGDDGTLVLSAQGWAADHRYARACLRQLLAPVLDELSGLPDPHGKVLTAALNPTTFHNDPPHDAGSHEGGAHDGGSGGGGPHEGASYDGGSHGGGSHGGGAHDGGFREGASYGGGSHGGGAHDGGFREGASYGGGSHGGGAHDGGFREGASYGGGPHTGGSHGGGFHGGGSYDGGFREGAFYDGRSHDGEARDGAPRGGASHGGGSREGASCYGGSHTGGYHGGGFHGGGSYDGRSHDGGSHGGGSYDGGAHEGGFHGGGPRQGAFYDGRSHDGEARDGGSHDGAPRGGAFRGGASHGGGSREGGSHGGRSYDGRAHDGGGSDGGGSHDRGAHGGGWSHHGVSRDRAPHDGQVQVAVLALLDRLAASRPVLLCVDDIDACDRAFLDALCAGIRLLAGRPLRVVLTARGETPPPGLPPALECLHLGPLSAPSAAALLDRQPAAPTGRRRLEILEEAEGNPLALVELSRHVPTACRAAGTGTAPARRPPTGHAFAARLDALPPKTARALLYAAAAGPGESVAALMAALDTDDLAVWAPAEAAGLVSLVEDRLVFRHPLARSAAFFRHTASERQQARLDLAETATRPEHRACHLAAATLRSNESVAAALEDLAWRHGDVMGTARALEQAARLSPRRRERARRLAEALVAAHAVGEPDWVRDLYGRLVQDFGEPEQVCAAAGALASILSLESSQREAFDLLVDVSEHFAAAGRPVALAVTAVAAGIAAQSGLPEHRAGLATLLDRARGTDPALRRPPPVTGFPGLLDGPDIQRALDALATAVLRPQAGTGSSARPVRPHGVPLDGPQKPACRTAVLSVAHLADEADVRLGQFRETDARLRTSRAFGIRGWSVLALADTFMGVGRFTDAAALIREAAAEAAVLRLPRLQADLEAQALALHALRGTVPPEPLLTPSVWRGVCLDENRATHARLLRARGLAAMALGDWDDGWRHLRELFTADGSPLHPVLSPRSIAELAAAAQRTGRSEAVVSVLSRVRAEQGERPSTRMTLLLHHATALVDPGGDAEQHFHLALVNHEADRWPWERAHVRLNYGIWLRRGRRPREARQQLTTVLETAERLGAGALAAAAAGELRASGAASTPDTSGTLEQLTAQQRQIVQLAARGLSNREIGEQLFLSPRTVGSHLYNVYPKLGISRRQQLRDLLQDR